jgi:ribonuclease D
LTARAPDAAWIDTPEGLAEVVAAAAAAPAYAVDTEFHREKTYWPRLALVQLNWGDGNVLVDPTAVDIAPLASLLEGPGTAVMHAAAQDLEVLHLACGSIPSSLFDTQIAAGFAGMSSPSLSSLVERMLGVRVPKADRLTDWLHRPLATDQLSYAASDVAHLLDLEAALRADLERRGRLQWALDECELFRTKPLPSRDPEAAWLRVKDGRTLRGRAAAVAQAVAAWREERAAEVDQPTRFVLSDLALLSIAQRPPSSVEGLGKVRGLDGRAVKGRLGQELFSAIERGMEAPVPPRPEGRSPNVDSRLRPVVSLLAAWVSQVAHQLELDTALVATRTDIELLVSGDRSSRLASGWRAELVGSVVEQLVDGSAALAFDHGSLVLEARSRRPL